MGCDIHFVVEQNIDGMWLPSFSTQSVFWNNKEQFFRNCAHRNYRFFRELADVRPNVRHATSAPTQKLYDPVPPDINPYTRKQIAYWGNDGHTHGCVTLRHFATAYFLSSHKAAVAQMTKDKFNANDFLLRVFRNQSSQTIDNTRVIFWFDN